MKIEFMGSMLNQANASEKIDAQLKQELFSLLLDNARKTLRTRNDLMNMILKNIDTKPNDNAYEANMRKVQLAIAALQVTGISF